MHVHLASRDGHAKTCAGPFFQKESRQMGEEEGEERYEYHGFKHTNLFIHKYSDCKDEESEGSTVLKILEALQR